MARTAWFSPSVLSSAASGYRLPTLQVTLAFAEACGGDRAEWELRWRMLQGQADQRPKRSRAVVGVAAPAPLLVNPAQLPIGPHDFIGRTAELAGARSVVSPLADIRLPLVISGPVGAGKTAFALRLAHELAADFPDGHLYADMGVGRPDGTSPFEVIAGFLGALGVPLGEIPADDTHRIGLFRSMLARWRVIVLLDDVRDEGQVRPLLARSMRSQIVVTSRARLLGLDGVRRSELNVFTRGESMELIRGLVGDERMRAEREAHFRLAELCDDLPLAVTIAGRKIAAQPGRNVSQIIGQLAEGTHRIQWLRVGDMSLRNALTSAYLRLTPMARRVFHQLDRCGVEGVAAGDLVRPMKIAIDSAEHMLETLVDCGLLRHLPRSGRYVMSTLVSLFAENQLGQLRDSSRYADDSVPRTLMEVSV